MDCIVFFNVLHNFSCFFGFYQCYLFAFYMVLFILKLFRVMIRRCDASIVFEYLMSLKIWIKICLNQCSACSPTCLHIYFKVQDVLFILNIASKQT